jgi:Leucine-rich repeat (LRR) protein
MDEPTPMNLPALPPLPLPTSSTITPPTIELRKYIYDMTIFNSKSFITTLAAFSIFKPATSPQNDMYDFIKQFFNFDSYGRNMIYINHTNPQAQTMQSIILMGLYNDFETLFRDIDASFVDDTVKCSLRDKKLLNDEFKKHMKNLNISTHPLINNFLKKIPNELHKKVLTLIFYCVCIKPVTRELVMAHYLLAFMKTSVFQKHQLENKIQLDYTVNTGEADIINQFFVKIDSFEVLPFMIRFPYTDLKGHDNIFSTCGETTLLNLLNYCIINLDGSFTIKDTFSVPLKQFYKSMPTMKYQLANQDEMTKAWLDVVSNLPKRDIYYPSGDIIPTKENIEYVLKTILNSEMTDIIDILLSIQPKIETEILASNDLIFRFSINGILEVYFTKGHAEMNTIEIRSYGAITWDDEDCQSLYSIFSTIDYTRDFAEELSLSICSYLLDTEDAPVSNPVIDFYLSTMKSLDNPDTPMDFPQSIHKLINLESLLIRVNNPHPAFTALPESLQSLKKLTRLVVDVPNIPIPEWIGNLTSLTVLSFTNCNLTSLPLSMKNISNLEHLSINTNQLTILPDWIGSSFPNLISLYAQENQISEVPDTIGNLSKLEELDLSHNEIKVLPASFRNLTSLIELTLNRNIISNISWIESMPNLEFFNVNRNHLSDLSAVSFSTNTKLKKLYLNKNYIRSLPDSFGDLSEVTFINLADNQLTELPFSIGKLGKLTELVLDRNRLVTLPESIGDLENLEYLSISHNPITSLPESITKLKKVDFFNMMNLSLPNPLPAHIRSFGMSVFKKTLQTTLRQNRPVAPHL